MSTIGSPPRYLEIPQLPQYVYTELQRLESAIRQLFGVTEQEIGTTRADQSGRAAAILEAQSSESIAPIVVVNNMEWVDMYKAILLIAQAYYSQDRIWTISGRERVRTYSWSTVNLNPGWDVVLAEADSLSKNPAIRQQQLNEMWGMGIFMDPNTGQNDVKTYLRMSNIRMPGVGPDAQGSEHAYFASIPDRIKRGIPFFPRPWDNPWVAQEELAAWLKGPGRDQEPEQVVQQVGQIYMYYSSMLPYTPQTLQVAPNPMAQQQSNVGLGAGEQPRVSTVQQGSMAQEAGQNFQNADAVAEKQAQITQNHEG
jgi:hypothetical protein